MPINVGIFPDGDEWDELKNAFLLSSSLADQLGDRMNQRLHDDQIIRGTNIIPMDDADRFIKALQTEVIRLREDNNLLANTVRSLESNNQVLIAQIKKILKKQEEKKK